MLSGVGRNYLVQRKGWISGATWHWPGSPQKVEVAYGTYCTGKFIISSRKLSFWDIIIRRADFKSGKNNYSWENNADVLIADYHCLQSGAFAPKWRM